MYGVCVTVLSLCLVYSVQPFFQYISVPEFPSCLLISSNLQTITRNLKRRSPPNHAHEHRHTNSNV